MSQYFAILKQFPTLIPNVTFTFWNGIIIIEGEEVPVKMSTPNYPSLNEFSIVCPVNVKSVIEQKMKNYHIVVGGRNDSLLHLLEYLCRKGNTDNEEDSDKDGKLNKSSVDKLNYYRYSQILNELKQIGSENIVTCSGDLSEMTLQTVDVRGVVHQLRVEVSPAYPSQRARVVDVDLPHTAVPGLSQVDTVLQMFKTFQALVDSFQDFWKAYEDLTKNTWVIDPEHPSPRDTHCRIIIGDNVSMLVTLNPQDINTCPDIKFLGPDNSIIPYISSVENKLKTAGWDEYSSVLDNLLTLLDLTQFPQPDSQTDTELRQDECSICFMVKIQDQALPTKVCNNLKCNSHFHLSCLAQWFQAVPTNETSFSLISGDCPCCGEKILCPIKMS